MDLNNSKNDFSGLSYPDAVNLLSTIMESGDVHKSLSALEYIVTNYEQVQDEIKNILTDLRNKMGVNINAPLVEKTSTEKLYNLPQGEKPSKYDFINSEILEKNINCLRLKFPDLVEVILNAKVEEKLTFKLNQNSQAILFYAGTPLVNIEKPDIAGATWVKQNTAKFSDNTKQELLILGLANGYHLNSLVAQGFSNIHLFESNLGLIKAVFGVLDCTSFLDKLQTFSLVVADLEKDILKRSAKPELLIFPQSKLTSGADIEEVSRKILSEKAFTTLHPRIAVISPMYGGSLPIAHYVNTALKNLNQRVIEYDLSPFYQGFKDIGGMFKNANRKNTIESNYVEMLSQTVLAAIDEKPVDIVLSLAQAPLSPTVLKELRKRGIITAMWFVEDCLRFDTWKYLAQYYDYFFIIQKGDYLNKVNQAGAGRVAYVPVGCDLSVHKPLPDLSLEDKRRFGSELSFVGAGYYNRRNTFAVLANRDFKIWGTEWPSSMPFAKFLQENGRRISPDDYVKIFNSSTINLNLHSSTDRDGVEPNGDFVNPRTFELAACGAFQLVDERTLMPEKFKINEEIAVFHDRQEMLDKIDYYLAHPEERAKIVKASRARVLSEHTYEHRVKSILEYIFADRFNQLKEREKSSTWNKVLERANNHPELKDKLNVLYQRNDEPVLETLFDDIQRNNGQLSDTEQKILIMHHIYSQTARVQEILKGQSGKK
ncbi:MAG: glycosyltransferase [Proteobacteria bacterium]|nr:glycosyltransferase [Pseudomonadota bacterium]